MAGKTGSHTKTSIVLLVCWCVAGVTSWHFEQHVDEGVYIPGGCPHQVRNLMSCSKVSKVVQVHGLVSIFADGGGGARGRGREWGWGWSLQRFVRPLPSAQPESWSKATGGCRPRQGQMG